MNEDKKEEKKKEKNKWTPPKDAKTGKLKRKTKLKDVYKLPNVALTSKCKLRAYDWIV